MSSSLGICRRRKNSNRSRRRLLQKHAFSFLAVTGQKPIAVLIGSGGPGTIQFWPFLEKRPKLANRALLSTTGALPRSFGRVSGRCTQAIAFLPLAEMLQANRSAKGV